ncbi:hypothetical protein [Paenibacillus dendritiformis]|uniref:hypothetical protein n=1 Tax=Paenibacillus dendritiformis TaxID=130049 RepID=UPI00387E171B
MDTVKKGAHKSHRHCKLIGAAVGVDGSTENVEAGKGEKRRGKERRGKARKGENKEKREKDRKGKKRRKKTRKCEGMREYARKDEKRRGKAGKGESTARATWQRATGDDGEGSEILRECSNFRDFSGDLMKFLQKYIISIDFCL